VYSYNYYYYYGGGYGDDDSAQSRFDDPTPTDTAVSDGEARADISDLNAETGISVTESPKGKS